MVAIKIDKRNGDALGTGRRKSSVARVRVRQGTGKVTINRCEVAVYFQNVQDQNAVFSPLEATGHRSDLDVLIRVHGGGTSGQSGACRMGIARAICSFDIELFEKLRSGKFLTRDSRMKERKKCGLRGARRGVQFSKR